MGTNYYLYDEEKQSKNDDFFENGSLHICKNHSFGVNFYISRQMQMAYLKALDQDKLLIVDEYGTKFTPRYLIDLVEDRSYTEDDHHFF